MKRLWKIAGIATLVAILGVVAVGAVAYAQDDSSSGSFDFATRFKETLAGILGISVDKYDEAVTQAEEQTLAEGVSDGLLTQEQADRMQERLDKGAGAGVPGMGMRGPGMGRGSGAQSVLLTVAADKLGMTEEELRTELRSGKSIADLAAEKGVDTQVISDEYLAQTKAKLDAQVADGSLTQAEADTILKEKTDNLPTRLTDTTWSEPGRGHGHGGRDNPTDEDSNTSTEDGL